MIFNKKLDNGPGYQNSLDMEPRSVGSVVALNQNLEMLRQRGGNPARSVIDAWLTMMGNLQSEGDIQVDGRVEGQVRCRQLIIGKDASVIGDVVAEEVVVRGKVKGVVRANSVRLQETARVESEVFFFKTLAIEDGASFEGQIRRAAEPVQIANTTDESAVLKLVEPGGDAGKVGAQNNAENDAKPSRSQPKRERDARPPVTNPHEV